MKKIKFRLVRATSKQRKLDRCKIKGRGREWVGQKQKKKSLQKINCKFKIYKKYIWI